MDDDPHFLSIVFTLYADLHERNQLDVQVQQHIIQTKKTT